MFRFESVLEDIDSAFILKEEQRNVIKAFVDQKYVFAVLPTGFGKNCIYQLAPMTTTLIQLSEQNYEYDIVRLGLIHTCGTCGNGLVGETRLHQCRRQPLGRLKHSTPM